MKTPSDPKGPDNPLYEKIIGLGEKSIRKSYYPLLRQKITELEKSNLDLERALEEHRKTGEELRRKIENQNILNELLRLSLEPMPLEDLFRMTMDSILSLSWIGKKASAAVFFQGENQDGLVLNDVKTVSGFPGPSCTHVEPGRCFCGEAALNGRPCFGIHNQGPMAHGHYCVPIRLEHKTIGVICLALPGDHPYDPAEEDLLCAISNTLAGIIQKKMVMEEKRQLENQLRQTQKMEAIGTLAGGIAHDFNNLLTPILGYTEMVLQDAPKDSTMAANLAEVLKAAGHAKGLVRQILSLSRQSRYEVKPLRLEDVVGDALKLLRSTIPSTIEIRHRLSADNRTVTADTTQVHQVIMNLCTNAFHAMKNTGGVLSVNLLSTEISPDSKINRQDRILEPGPYQVIEVSDTGTGMDKAVMERIFDPYFTTKGSGEGTGLGLSVVHGIIKNYGGAITVHSKPGQGTTFRVYLPCSNTPFMDETKDVTEPVPRGTERILVVDDETAIVDLVSSMLKSRGYTVTGCAECSAALNLFRKDPQAFDLVITDMTMPHMTGIQLAQALRAIRPDIPLIVCTGFSELIDEAKALDLGFQKFLMKPIVRRDLCRTVRDVLDQRVKTA